MLIKGIQKVTLLDYPGKIACTIFTGGCNFRCPFCQNASLVTHIDDDQILEDDFWQFLEERKGKLDAVCISGGEPCLQKDLKSFIKRIKDMGYLVKLDTNGYMPLVLQDLLTEHLLDYVAMDVKNTKEKYEMTAGVKVDLEKIEKSIDLLKNSLIEHEFRTTIVKDFHTKDDVKVIAKWLYPSKLYLQQFKDSIDVIQKGLTEPSKEELVEMQKEAQQENSQVYLRGI